MKRLFALILMMSIASVARSATPVQLTLRSDAVVSGARVTLADVAALDEVDQGKKIGSAWSTLAAIVLGITPRPGYTDRYSRKEIERLVRQSGIDGTIDWRGADAVRIERIAYTFDPKKISDIAEAYLRELLRSDGSRVELQLEAGLRDLRFPSGQLELKPRAMQSTQAMHSRVAIWVDVIIDGLFVRSVTVPFKVQVYRPVLIAKRDLPKGTVPQCDTLQVREENVAPLESPPFPADCNLVQGNLKRGLAQGAPLLKSALQMPVAVTQGESVSLQLIAGALKLESRAVALADGEQGQRIFVKPSSGTETVLAEVIAPGVVKVSGK